MLADDIRSGTAGPDLQLVRSGSAEGIAGDQQHLFALLHLLLGDLADGGGLTNTVNADHQDHSGGCREVQLRAAHIQHGNQDRFQRLLGFLRGF